MIDIELLALILLVGRGASVVFIAIVLFKQIRLFRLPIDDSIRDFRRVLFVVCLVIAASNIVPTTIDLLTLFIPIGRPAQVGPVGVVYALSNSFIAAILSLLVWLLYRTAAKSHNVK